MAKRRQKQSGNRLFRQLLYVLIIGILALIIYIFDIDIEGITNPAEESETVIEPPPVSGEFYSLYFTRVINSSDENAHHGSTLEQALIAEIDSAQKTIDAALFELNAPDTTEAFKRALQRGVKVRIVADDEHNIDDPESTLQELIDLGAEVKSDDRGALMHNKYLIIDGKDIWTGSTNLTRNDIYNNNNSAMLFKSLPSLVQNFQNDFDEMFLDGAFSDSDDTRPVSNRNITIGNTQIETYFSPDDGEAIEARLTELINQSQTSIRVMAFSFTLETLAQAMVDRHTAGVSVEGVFETTGSLQGEMRTLACAGIAVRQDGNPDILHSKVFVFDEKIVAMGSFNFSNSARDNNSENLLIIHNPDIAQAYLAEWQARFNEGRVPSASDLDC
jgi:phosphatidylserine/phosphatidylglycerophosphate/cardiolipin synthase-like enzyme